MFEPREETDGTSVLKMPRSLRLGEVGRLFRELGKRGAPEKLRFDFSEVEDFDSSAVAFVSYVRRRLPGAEVVNLGPGLEAAVRNFLPRAGEQPRTGARDGPVVRRFLVAVGERAGLKLGNVARFFVMLGDEVYFLFRYLLFDRRGVYPGETWNQLFFMGYRSYPIVAVLIFLVGVTISITSSDQLRLFGADVYLADIVGLAMLRELVPLMTGVILSGKVGAAVAAELSTMSVLEEVDALKTMGVAPEKYLMVPRLLGITLAVPLLVAMADAVGIFGGVVVAQLKFGIPPSAFIREMMTIVEWDDFMWGLVKSVIFGWAIVVGSGYKGLSVGRSAAEVGRATTESVVLSVTLIILIDCVFAFILY